MVAYPEKASSYASGNLWNGGLRKGSAQDTHALLPALVAVFIQKRRAADALGRAAGVSLEQGPVVGADERFAVVQPFDFLLEAFDFLAQAELRLEADSSSDRFYASEIYRLFGDAYLRSGKSVIRAEQYILKGLAIAREQGSRSFQLRCLSSACDMDGSPHIGTYRSQLAELYLSFSEGFDTADLVKASERCRVPAAAQSSA